jgi:hypothetical protein
MRVTVAQMLGRTLVGTKGTCPGILRRFGELDDAGQGSPAGQHARSTPGGCERPPGRRPAARQGHTPGRCRAARRLRTAARSTASSPAGPHARSMPGSPAAANSRRHAPRRRGHGRLCAHQQGLRPCAGAGSRAPAPDRPPGLPGSGGNGGPRHRVRHGSCACAVRSRWVHGHRGGSLLRDAGAGARTIGAGCRPATGHRACAAGGGRGGGPGADLPRAALAAT